MISNRRDFIRGCSSFALLLTTSSDTLLAELASSFPVQPEPFGLDSFRTCLGSTFLIKSGAGSASQLTLVDADCLSQTSAAVPHAAPCSGECFLLTFRGTADLALRQDTYAFDHRTLGPFAMFIVPVQVEHSRHTHYQAVFNRSLPSASNHRALGAKTHVPHELHYP